MLFYRFSSENYSFFVRFLITIISEFLFESLGCLLTYESYQRTPRCPQRITRTFPCSCLYLAFFELDRRQIVGWRATPLLPLSTN